MQQSNFTKLGHMPQNPIIVDTYRPHDQSQIMPIDEALGREHCLQIDSFKFKVGGCLFDTIDVLLDGWYTPIDFVVALSPISCSISTVVVLSTIPKMSCTHKYSMIVW